MAYDNVMENQIVDQKQEYKDRILFERIQQTIIDQQLFLNPSFSRETYIKLALVNKNRVAQLLKKYAGKNLNAYINDFRLDYAAKLLEIDSNAPMKAVAINAGFKNIRTFYRLFLAKFGVTPSTYKRNL